MRRWHREAVRHRARWRKHLRHARRLFFHRNKIFQVPRPRDILAELRLQEGLAEVGHVGRPVRHKRRR